MSEQRIAVSVRIRPPIQRERYEPVCARKADDDQTIIIKPEENAANMGESSAFQFDFVFDETDDQSAVYEEAVQELVDHALSGNNATVLTYGQTGSGKTFTILGNMSTDGKVTAQSGVFLRVFDDLFTYRSAVKSKMHLIVTLSALELYVEEVMDLLSSKKKLRLRESAEETLTIGINTVEVQNMEDVIKNFRIANSFRSVTATKMNDSSSRSHALFFIDLYQVPVEQCPEVPPLAKLIDEHGVPIPNAVPGLVRSRIALADLAGSERVKRSGVTGQGMLEAQAINKSLSTLGTVINAMYLQSSHIPFRESKLTKLLKPSFVDPTSRLLLIGQVAPPTNSAAESLGTLRFCDRVKGLKAGQVMGFSDPEEEMRFLSSKKTNEELTAEMRILAKAYYYTPVNLLALAKAKGESKDMATSARVQELQAGAADVITRHEQEELRRFEKAAFEERDASVEAFVVTMNSKIEEYEAVAHALKKEKKGAKKIKEERDATIEGMLHEAKKAKKARVKLQEQLAEVQAAVTEATATVRDLEEAEQQQQTAAGASNAEEDAEDDDTRPSQLCPSITIGMEKAAHQLDESFYTHSNELGRVYQQYVSRLAATARQRSQVRRMKLLSSTLVTEGSLLYDLLAFMVERAVDIAEGDIPMTSRWNWHDVDGLSRQLLNADQMYPPLLVLGATMDSGAEPCAEEFHRITFLSSDESDGENSHHAAESRRPRNMQRGSLQIAGGDSADRLQDDDDEDLDEEDDSGEAAVDHGVESSAAESEEDEVEPSVRPSGWMQSVAPASTAAEQQAPASETNAAGSADTAAQQPSTKKHHRHRRGRKEDAADVEEAARAPSSNATTRSDGADSAVRSSSAGAEAGDGNGKPAAEDETVANGEKSPSKTRGKHRKSDAQSAVPLSKEEEDRQYLMKVYDSATLVQDLIKFLRGGTVMLKHGRHGKPHRRLFWISTARGRKELLWMEPDAKQSTRSSIQLDTVSSIQLGCFSKVLRRHPVRPGDPAFFRCFTLGLKGHDRTVDVVADTLPDFEAWVVGLSHLVGVDPSFGGKLDISKEHAFERLTYFESNLCESNFIYPVDYMRLKKEVQQRATRTLEVLEKCGNDATKAQQILGTIHVPAVNGKGAVYLTKGELRFLLPELNLDIFRISRVWMLLQQMNIVYDENFLPATAFGITRREYSLPRYEKYI